VPTILKAGFRSNVIQSEAEATLDVRALPDENLEQFYGESWSNSCGKPCWKCCGAVGNVRRWR